jgi:hypothetical protein
VRNRQLDATTQTSQVPIGRKDRRLLTLGLQRQFARRKTDDLVLKGLQSVSASGLRQPTCLEGVQVPVNDGAARHCCIWPKGGAGE